MQKVRTKGRSQRTQEEMEGRSPGVAGSSRDPRVGGRKRGREDPPDEDGRSGGTKRCRRNLEQHRAAVAAEEAAAWSTYSLLTRLIAGLDAEIARAEKELDR